MPQPAVARMDRRDPEKLSIRVNEARLSHELPEHDALQPVQMAQAFRGTAKDLGADYWEAAFRKGKRVEAQRQPHPFPLPLPLVPFLCGSILNVRSRT